MPSAWFIIVSHISNTLKMVVIPYVSVSPGKLACYSRMHGFNSFRSERQILNQKNLDDNTTAGLISKKARTKITAGIDWLLFLASDKRVYSERSGKYFKFKIMFVTLTLSSQQRHSDNFIKSELLNQFLIEARKKWQAKKYIWRAESQLNGRIHFHIVFDVYIPWQWIKKTWNRIQNKYSYVDKFAKSQHDKYKKGFFFQKNDLYNRSRKQQLKHYKNGIAGDWYKPNSTDVHSIKKVKNISSYLAKYCTKNDSHLYQAKIIESSLSYYKIDKSLGVRQIEGRLWGLSQSLSCLKTAIEIIDNEISAELSNLCLSYPNRVRTFDYCTVIYLDFTVLEFSNCNALLSLLHEYHSGFKDN